MTPGLPWRLSATGWRLVVVVAVVVAATGGWHGEIVAWGPIYDPPMSSLPLPIDERLGEIAALVAQHRRLVVVAPPGAGKTTRVPPALLDAGPLLLLQPRRVAAPNIFYYAWT